jgi:PAS domain S-box-containing protein
MNARPVSVLLIEDNPADARLIRELLRDVSGQHIEFDLVSNLNEGIEHLAAGGVDVVLVDLSLPDSTGVETCRSLHDKSPAVPVVVLTGLSDQKTALKALRHGAQDYLIKGEVNGAMLWRVINYAIERTQISQERDTALQALKVSERRYRALYDDMPAIFAKFDADGRVLSINRFGANFLGYETKELFDGGFLSRVVDNTSAVRSDLHKCIRLRGLPLVTKWAVNHCDSRRIWLRATLRKVAAEDGSDRVLAACEDVTAADMQERYLNAVLNSIRDGIVACDMRGNLTLINPATRDLLPDLDDQPRSPREWVERFALYDADGHTPFPADELPLHRALQGRITANREMTIGAPDAGTRKYVAVSGQPMYDADGSELGAVVSVHDLTERRSIELQFQQAQKMEAIGQLTGGLAHDFNNLLAVIVGNLQLLNRALPDGNETVHRQLASAQEAAMRGSKLTRQLLAFARGQALEPRAIKLGDQITDVKEIIERTLGHNIDIRLTVADDLGWVRIDPSLLESALLNLAINARDAMPDGGTISIKLSNARLDEAYAAANPDARPGDYIMVAVADTGCGMTKEVLSRVLEPFYSTKEVGKGTGLGLSMVYGFVKQSGGHLKLYSEVGHGTVVRMYLPRANKQEVERAEHDSAMLQSLPSGSETILVVDDDPSLLEVSQALLENMGYTVIPAGSGAEAIEVVNGNGEIDLVFTDMVMPGGISGIDLAKSVREHRPDTKVLFTSGFTETVMFSQSDVGDRSLLLIKPYAEHELALRVRRVLDGL